MKTLRKLHILSPIAALILVALPHLSFAEHFDENPETTKRNETVDWTELGEALLQGYKQGDGWRTQTKKSPGNQVEYYDVRLEPLLKPWEYQGKSLSEQEDLAKFRARRLLNLLRDHRTDFRSFKLTQIRDYSSLRIAATPQGYALLRAFQGDAAVRIRSIKKSQDTPAKIE